MPPTSPYTWRSAYTPSTTQHPLSTVCTAASACPAQQRTPALSLEHRERSSEPSTQVHLSAASRPIKRPHSLRRSRRPSPLLPGTHPRCSTPNRISLREGRRFAQLLVCGGRSSI